MKIKNYKDYPEILALNDTYDTDSKIPKSPIASFLFYYRLVKIVKYANSQTKINIYNRYNWVASSIAVLRATESIGIKIHVRGMKNLSRFEGPAVIIGNHMSTMETLLLPSMIQLVKSVVFIIKKELVDFPLFGPVAAARHPIIVGRTNPREDLKIVMEEGSQKLQNGRSIIIFPQKTRTSNFDKSQFNSLGIKLAKKNNVPVVPVAIITDAWANGKIIKELGKIDTDKKVHFEFGEPLFISGNGNEEHEKVLQFIESKFIELGRKDLIV